MYLTNYQYKVENHILFITDLNKAGQPSVTNSIEQIISQITQEIGSLEKYIIIYRDSEGNWDGVDYFKRAGRGLFYPLNTKNPVTARQKAMLYYRLLGNDIPAWFIYNTKSTERSISPAIESWPLSFFKAVRPGELSGSYTYTNKNLTVTVKLTNDSCTLKWTQADNVLLQGFVISPHLKQSQRDFISYATDKVSVFPFAQVFQKTPESDVCLIGCFTSLKQEDYTKYYDIISYESMRLTRAALRAHAFNLYLK